MNLQQLRFICAVVRQNFNALAAADSLYTSQPGVSKQIQLLEDEISVVVMRSFSAITRRSSISRFVMPELL
ncbi:LysR family transcriptional regulator [Acidithiobacillus ferrianus]|uniref:LysR family transcriptional regulator n=1 Tax=Acidithiobacillus ferrianus TaxID=2678518 RepID=A0ACD5H8W5_9PROT|nr:LysR family transcriptional regulator [Acidithiobacillus ferrianus]